MSTWREITQVDSNTVWQLLASAQQSTGGLNPPSFLKPPISPVLAEEDQDDGTAFIFSKIYLSHRGQLVLQHSVLFYIFMFSWDLKATLDPCCVQQVPGLGPPMDLAVLRLEEKEREASVIFHSLLKESSTRAVLTNQSSWQKSLQNHNWPRTFAGGRARRCLPAALAGARQKETSMEFMWMDLPEAHGWQSFHVFKKPVHQIGSLRTDGWLFMKSQHHHNFLIGMKRTTFISHHSDPQKYVGFCDNSCPSAWTTIACCSTARFHECPIKTFPNWGNVFPNSNLKIITY